MDHADKTANIEGDRQLSYWSFVLIDLQSCMHIHSNLYLYHCWFFIHCLLFHGIDLLVSSLYYNVRIVQN